MSDGPVSKGRPALEAIDVGKAYGARRALAGVGFAVWPGEIVGLLGPNGAGKTTALSILSTILVPDSGRVVVDGGSPRSDPRLRRRLGLVPQSLALYPTLSAAQNVAYFARMYGLSRRDAAVATARALEAVGLADRAREPTRTLSGGMQRRVNLACGIVHRPAVLLLDEPTVGVDLESREHILGLVRRLRDAGTAVVYSTHYMEEAERICDRVLLIDRGALLADGPVQALIAHAGNRPRMTLTCQERLPHAAYAELAGVRALAVEEGRVTLEMETLAQVAEVLDRVRTSGVAVLDFTLHSPNLADAFRAITGHSLRPATPA